MLLFSLKTLNAKNNSILPNSKLQFRIGEDAIVQPENFERKELTFKVVQISSPELANLTGFDLKREVSRIDRKSTRLNSSHVAISYAVFCLKKKKKRKAY